MIVYSTSSGPTPINYEPPNVVTKDQVQDMIGQPWTLLLSERDKGMNSLDFLCRMSSLLNSPIKVLPCCKIYNKLRCLYLKLLCHILLLHLLSQHDLIFHLHLSNNHLVLSNKQNVFHLPLLNLLHHR